ncbi:hypothetical protein EDD11_001398 [Mortierella claussenii]|nr:hypothetical protein EDD11_001398 [Mortierella claussenii]
MDFFSLYGGDKDKDCGGQKPMVELQWYHVAIASVLIIVNGILSIVLRLGLEKRLFIAAIRCIVQLTIMGLVLQNIFDAQNPLLVILMALLLTCLGAYEAVFNVSKRRHIYMFPSVLISMGCSCLIIGTFALGMLLGNTMTAISLGLDQCLSQLSENKEKIELYLSMGATRWEACRPVAIEAMRRAMLPTINQMSIIGLISIPGMMTGQLIAGASVMNAAKSQQIIMFLISGAAAFGTLSSVLICLRVCFDSSDRLRPERIIKTKSIVPKGVSDFFSHASERLREMLCCCWNKPKSKGSPSLEQGQGRRSPSGHSDRSKNRNNNRNSDRDANSNKNNHSNNNRDEDHHRSNGSTNKNDNKNKNHDKNGEPTERTPLVR